MTTGADVGLSWDGFLLGVAEFHPVFLIGGADSFVQSYHPLGDDAASLTRFERTGLPLGGEKIDPMSIKLITKIYPVIEGSYGNVVQVYVGGEMGQPGEGVIWKGPFNFTIGVSRHVDCLVPARFGAIAFQRTGTTPWIVLGYGVDFEVVASY